MRSTALAKPAPELPARLRKKLEQAVSGWLSELGAHTRRSYHRGLQCFGKWLIDQSVLEPQETADKLVEASGRYLLALTAPDANALVGAYLHDRLYPENPEDAYARATVEIRLAAIRWAVRQARRLGHTTWILDVSMPKPRKGEDGKLAGKKGRDMRAPSPAKAKRMLTLAQEDPDPRTWFIVSCCLREGFREHEIRQLDFEDIHLRKRTATMVRKKRSEPEPYPLSDATLEALRAWLSVRGRKPGALIYGGRHGNNPRTRIGHTMIWEIVNRVGNAAGVPNGTSPHKCRHRACTDIVRVATKQGLPEEELLRLTGHSSRDALRPYYEAINQNRSGRDVLNAASALEDEEEEEEDDDSP